MNQIDGIENLALVLGIAFPVVLILVAAYCLAGLDEGGRTIRGEMY